MSTRALQNYRASVISSKETQLLLCRWERGAFLLDSCHISRSSRSLPTCPLIVVVVVRVLLPSARARTLELETNSPANVRDQSWRFR